MARTPQTIGECVGGSAGEGGAPEGGAGEMGGAAGVAGAGGAPEVCDLDEPLAIAQSLGLSVQIYTNFADPNIVAPSGFVQSAPDRSGNNRPFVQTTPAWRPELVTSGPLAYAQGDGIDDRIEANWAAGRPSVAGPWGCWMISRYDFWERAMCSGHCSMVKPSVGWHSGEPSNFPLTGQGIRFELGGGTPNLIETHTANGVWHFAIAQYTNTTAADWACIGSDCRTGKRMGDSDSGKRFMFGCTNANWDELPVELGGHPGDCYAEVSHHAIMCWRGVMSVNDAQAFKPWVDSCTGGVVATN